MLRRRDNLQRTFKTSLENCLAAAQDIVDGYSRKEVMARRNLANATLHRIIHQYLVVKHVWRPKYDPENHES